MTAAEEDRIYIGALAESLGRAPHTIRQWLRRKDFPKGLRPAREGGREKIYWTPDQVAGLKEYAAERLQQRGSFGRAAA